MRRAVPRPLLALLAVPAAAALTGCASAMPLLGPEGPGAAGIARLSWLLMAATIVPALVVITLVVLAVRRGASRDEPIAVNEGLERRLLLGAGGVFPAVLLVSLSLASFRTGREVARPPATPDLTIEVIGHQFWWEVRYPAWGVVTANELHIPAGEPVRLEVTSADVIHSFWVPQLHGKIDMVPGRRHVFWLQADRPGVFRGQCAEFCGLQHALMALLVIAEPRDAFDAWIDHHARPAAPPADPLAARGRDVFAEASCHLCHAVRGAFEPQEPRSTGPDLTHLANRRMLAAAALPNTPDHLRAFIVDPHRRKPGLRMPATPLEPDRLEALLAYLDTLR